MVNKLCEKKWLTLLSQEEVKVDKEETMKERNMNTNEHDYVTQVTYKNLYQVTRELKKKKIGLDRKKKEMIEIMYVFFYIIFCRWSVEKNHFVDEHKVVE